uniref:Uncharacterized protein n=1 Tax=Rhipicephalus appendiculatus TaxID=34631 RepID=A0A131YDY0_RHIAP
MEREFQMSIKTHEVAQLLSIFECTCRLHAVKGLIMPNIPLKLSVEHLLAFYYCLDIKYAACAEATLEFLLRYLAGTSQENHRRQNLSDTEEPIPLAWRVT